MRSLYKPMQCHIDGRKEGKTMDYLQKRKRAGRKPEKRRSKTASGEEAGLMERGKATLSCFHFSVLKRQAHGSAALLLQRVKVPEVAWRGGEWAL